MPKVKIPRKSTTIDMTAMCDVAFLLLSFFILATKTKPPEAVSVNTPTSVSKKVAPDTAFVISLAADGRTFLMMGEGTYKDKILSNINATNSMGLDKKQLEKWQKSEVFGTPLGEVRGMLMLENPPPAAKQKGIPTDSTNNEMIKWIKAIKDVYAAEGKYMKDLQEMLLIKGDAEALYPKFKSIKKALKENEIYKFRLITSGVPVPEGSELFNNPEPQKSK